MASKHHALQRDSMADRVKQELLQRIMSGKLPPGSRLVEMQIAREFSTSQGPVREALCELEGLDLVVTEPYKGSYVRELNQQDIREAYMVRAALEELAGQLAAVHFRHSVSALQKEAKAILAAAQKNDVAGYTQHDIQFHRLIVEGASNRVLMRTWNSLAFEVRLHLWLSRGRIDLVKVQQAHWEIIDTLEAGDGLRAGQLLRRHILRLPATELIQVSASPHEPARSDHGPTTRRRSVNDRASN